MERKKIHLEYLLNAISKSILWTAISTPTGLEGWFADKVQSDDKTVSFFWGKTERRDAEIIAVRAYSFIRFRWLDDENPRCLLYTSPSPRDMKQTICVNYGNLR